MLHLIWITVWNDSRTEETVEKVLDKIPNRNPDHCKAISGLPISPYFSALKIMWLKENVPEVSEAFENKTCLVGTIDSWLVWVSEMKRKITFQFQLMHRFLCCFLLLTEFNWRTKRSSRYRCDERKQNFSHEFGHTSMG